MSAPVRIGVIGLGTVGQGVVRLLKNNAAEITRRVGRPVVVTDAATRTPGRARDCNLDGVQMWDDAGRLVREADVDIVVELIGGTGVARELTLAAIARGKPLVTANKALLAEAGNEIFAAAADADGVIGF